MFTKNIKKNTSTKKKEVKPKKIKLPIYHYTKPAEIKKVNNYLDKCAKDNKLRGVRRDKTASGETLVFANYDDNGMYMMSLNKQGYIKKITKF